MFRSHRAAQDVVAAVCLEKIRVIEGEPAPRIAREGVGAAPEEQDAGLDAVVEAARVQRREAEGGLCVHVGFGVDEDTERADRVILGRDVDPLLLLDALCDSGRRASCQELSKPARDSFPMIAAVRRFSLRREEEVEEEEEEEESRPTFERGESLFKIRARPLLCCDRPASSRKHASCTGN